jgi:hypothetical protein
MTGSKNAKSWNLIGRPRIYFITWRFKKMGHSSFCRRHRPINLKPHNQTQTYIYIYIYARLDTQTWTYFSFPILKYSNYYERLLMANILACVFMGTFVEFKKIVVSFQTQQAVIGTI